MMQLRFGQSFRQLSNFFNKRSFTYSKHIFQQQNAVRSDIRNEFVESAAKELNQSATSQSKSVFSQLQTKYAASSSVGYWMLGTTVSVFGIVVVGGLTRLTESGLSMTEWSLTGTPPPSNQQEWQSQFDKYKQSPEYQILNRGMELEEFKKIFWYEYIHRMIGRGIGLYYIAGASYFLLQSKKFGITSALRNRILLIGAMIGGQGLLGWYMVKSGLDHEFVQNELDGYPRVSQYRLASHLGSAFVIYCTSLYTGLSILRSKNQFMLQNFVNLKNLTRSTKGVTSLVFLTAISGAFVAGLDAGLIYNSFPKMGELWIPSDILARNPTWKNFFENPTTVQFDHRWLAMTTYACVLGLTLYARRLLKPSVLASRRLPTHVSQEMKKLRNSYYVLTAVGTTQVLLGVGTLLWLVPVPLAAAHQAGSLTLLTVAIWILNFLKILPKQIR